MAQLFTVYFPKYYFDLQKEFEMEFTFPLPFEYVVEDGNCYVSMIHYDQDNEGDAYFWQKKGLQPGLRVIGVNNKSLVDDYNIEDEDGHINADTILNEEAMEDLLAIGDTEAFTIEFREEVTPEDYSIPLGLGYTQQDLKEIEPEESTLSPNGSNIQIENTNVHRNVPSISHISISNRISDRNRNINHRISDSQIGASSFEKGYEPSECRLNNINSFWQPSG
eukprot:146234_1